MKKYIILALVVAVFLTAGLAYAQDSQKSVLQVLADQLLRLRNQLTQVAAVGSMPVPPNVLPPIHPDIDPPTPPSGSGCPTSQIPAGTSGQTVYCDGTNWKTTNALTVAENYLGNNLLQENGITIITSTSTNFGSLEINQLGSGFGIMQANGEKNYFAGKTGFGTAYNPQENIDLGGGNIKMGYEVVVNVDNDSASNSFVMCPAGKKVLGGGCNGSPYPLIESYPTPDSGGWQCNWDAPSTQFTKRVHAICANIR